MSTACWGYAAFTAKVSSEDAKSNCDLSPSLAKLNELFEILPTVLAFHRSSVGGHLFQSFFLSVTWHKNWYILFESKGKEKKGQLRAADSFDFRQETEK